MKKNTQNDVKISNVGNVCKENDRFCLRWTEIHSQTHHRKKTSASREDLEIYAAELRTAQDAESRGIKLKRLPKFGSAGFFKSAMGDVVSAARDAAARADMSALRVLGQYNKVLVDVSKGYHPYGDFLKTEEELEELVKFHETTQKSSEKEDATNGVSRASIAKTLSCGEGSEDPLC